MSRSSGTAASTADLTDVFAVTEEEVDEEVVEEEVDNAAALSDCFGERGGLGGEASSSASSICFLVAVWRRIAGE